MTSPEKKTPVGKDPAIISYESYRSRVGGIKQGLYEKALIRAGNLATKVNPQYARQAETIAKVFDVTLPPQTLKLYAILRSDTNEKENHTKLSDQSLLAEVLFQQGTHDVLGKLVKVYSHIFF